MNKIKFSKDEGTEFYKELNEIIYPFLMERGIIPNQTTYWGGIKGHLQLLKQRSIPNN